MRRLLQHNRWITVLVACLLLFATSGFSLTRMTCLMGGHTVFSFGQLDDCCPDEQGTDQATLKAECCAITQAKLEPVNVVVVNSLGLDPVFVAFGTAPFEVAQALVLVPLRWLDTRPPPLTVPDRLAVFSTFLI